MEFMLVNAHHAGFSCFLTLEVREVCSCYLRVAVDDSLIRFILGSLYSCNTHVLTITIDEASCDRRYQVRL